MKERYKVNLNISEKMKKKRDIAWKKFEEKQEIYVKDGGLSKTKDMEEKEIFAVSYAIKYKDEPHLIRIAKSIFDSWLLSPVIIKPDESIVGNRYIFQKISKV